MINEEEQKDRPPTEGPRGEERPQGQEAVDGDRGAAARNGAIAAGPPKQESQSTATEKREAAGQSSRSKGPRGPHPSLWPFVLALAIALACLGVVTHPAVLLLGAALIVVAIVGWGLERY
ncbi:cytochrome c oxidase subunit 4 [Thermogemmatispora sp.]|uniref:aa3-type cytochrome oxidase subunit IV n=1 Tax=Thermogemmatispora sp. TaxID=1968838 RepID=UPI002ACBED17|nr:cytochrome c oxidase subunit 4 [Thermogemmatispora sp.]